MNIFKYISNDLLYSLLKLDDDDDDDDEKNPLITTIKKYYQSKLEPAARGSTECGIIEDILKQIESISTSVKKPIRMVDIPDIKKQLSKVWKKSLPTSKHFLSTTIIEKLRTLETKSLPDESLSPFLTSLRKEKQTISQKLINEIPTNSTLDSNTVLNYLFSEIVIITNAGNHNKPPGLSKTEKQYIKDCITILFNPKFKTHIPNNDLETNCLISMRTLYENDPATKELGSLLIKVLITHLNPYHTPYLYREALMDIVEDDVLSLDNIFEYFLKPNTGFCFTLLSNLGGSGDEAKFFNSLFNYLANKVKEKFSEKHSAMIVGFLDELMPTWDNNLKEYYENLDEYKETSFIQNYVNLCLKLSKNDILKLKLIKQAFSEQIDLLKETNLEETKTLSTQILENLVKEQDSDILTYYEALTPNMRDELERELSHILKSYSAEKLQKLKQFSNPKKTIIGLLLNKIDEKKDISTVGLLNTLQLDHSHRISPFIQNLLLPLTRSIQLKIAHSVSLTEEDNNWLRLFSLLKINPGDFYNFQTTLLNLLNLNLFPSGAKLLALKKQLTDHWDTMTSGQIKKALIESMPVQLLVDKQELEEALPSYLVKKEQLIPLLEILDNFKNDYSFNSLLREIQKKEYNELFQFNLQLNYHISTILEESNFDFSTLENTATIDKNWQEQEDKIYASALNIQTLLKKLPATLNTQKEELEKSIALLKYDAGQILYDNLDKRKKALNKSGSKIEQKLSSLVNTHLTDLIRQIGQPTIDISMNFIDGCVDCVKNYIDLTTKIKKQLDTILDNDPEYGDIAYRKYNHKKEFIIETLNGWIEKEINRHTFNFMEDITEDITIDITDTQQNIQQQIDNQISPAIASLKQSLNTNIMVYLMNKIPLSYARYLTFLTNKIPSTRSQNLDAIKRQTLQAVEQLLTEEVQPKIESLIVTKCSSASLACFEKYYVKEIEKFEIKFPEIDRNGDYKEAVKSIDETSKKLNNELTTLVDKLFLNNATSTYHNSITEKKNRISDKMKKLKIKVMQNALDNFKPDKLTADTKVDKWIRTEKQKLKTLVNELCELLKKEETIAKVKQTQEKIIKTIEDIAKEVMNHALDGFKPEFPNEEVDGAAWLLIENHKLEAIVNPLCELLKKDQKAVNKVIKTQENIVTTINKTGMKGMQKALRLMQSSLTDQHIMKESSGLKFKGTETDKWLLTEKQKLEKIVNPLCELLKQDQQAIEQVKQTQEKIIKTIEDIATNERNKAPAGNKSKPTPKKGRSSSTSDDDEEKPVKSKGQDKVASKTGSLYKAPAKKVLANKKKESSRSTSPSNSDDDEKKPVKSKGQDKVASKTGSLYKAPAKKVLANKKKESSRSTSPSNSDDDEKKPVMTKDLSSKVSLSQAPAKKAADDKKIKPQKDRSRSASSSVDDRKNNKSKIIPSDSKVENNKNKKKPDIKPKIPANDEKKPVITKAQVKAPAKKIPVNKEPSSSTSPSNSENDEKKPVMTKDLSSKVSLSQTPAKKAAGDKKIKPQKDRSRSASSSVDDRKKPDIKPKKTLLSEMSVFNRPSRKQEESSSSPEQTPKVKKK